MASPVAVPTDTHVGIETYTLLNEGIIQGSVKQSIIAFFDPTGGLPVNPTLGDRYISLATANGWTINNIQYWNGDIWVDIVPQTGETLYNTATVGTFPLASVIWNGVVWVVDGGGAGDVVGPGASTDNAVVRWDGATGTAVQNSTVTISDTGDTVIPGSLQLPAGEPVGTTNVLSITSTAGVPTDLTIPVGSLVYDSAGTTLYIFNGVGWDAFFPGGVPSSESISIAGAGNNPDIGVITTFVSTTAAASGTLADGTTIGQLKYIVMSAYVGDYVMTVTNGLDANGAAITTITYTSAGQGSTLTWDGTNWLILNAGGVVA